MRSGANLRLFEIPAFGALQIASSSQVRWLEPQKEVLVYRDARHAASLVVEYLSRKTKREMVIHASRERVMREHTFRQRAKRLFRLLDHD